MLNTVRQKHWRKTQLWGLHKTQGGSIAWLDLPYVDRLDSRLFLQLEGVSSVNEKLMKPIAVSFGSSDLKWPLARFSRQVN